MATSGTIAQTQIDAAKIVEHAVRKCGVVPSLLSSEQLLAARENLFLRLVSLSNRGINLWCLERRVLPLLIGVAAYGLPSGTVEVLKALFRKGTATPATAYATVTASITYAAATAVTSVSLTAPAAGDYNLVVESSPDGATWTQRGAATWPGVTLGQVIGVDVPGFTQTLYWRARETVATITWADVLFLDTTTDLPMSPLNRDDYSSLPNKNFTSNTALQYWLDKQAAAPILYPWPLANGVGTQLVLWNQRQIQDVGALSNTLDLPQRWLNSIIFELAAVMYLELPKEMVTPGQFTILQGQADRYTREAEDGERDGAPIRVMPQIRQYTRG